MKKAVLISLKILIWIIGVVIFLVLTIFVLIEIPAVQDFARKKTVSYLQGKIKTKVEIQKISLDLPKLLVLEGVYFQDQKKDTLLAGDTLKVDISLFKLLHNELEINEIDLRGITTHIDRRLPDSTFNFDYIIKAFAGQKAKTTSKDTSAMKFSIGKINLDRIRARFKDEVTANDMDLYLGHFDTRIKEFNLDKMKFSIPVIHLSNLNAKVLQTKAVNPPPATTTAQPFNLGLKLGKIALDRIKIDYRNEVSAMKANVNLGKLDIESDQVDLKNQHINLNSINLKNSKILFQLGKKQKAEVPPTKIAAPPKNWRILAKTIHLEGNDIRFDNFNMPVQKRGMDYAHLNISGLKLLAKDLLYATDTISGKISAGSFKEQSGFVLQKLQTDFFYGKTQASFNNLYLATAKTLIKDRIRLNYSSIENITKNLGELRLDAHLSNSKLGFKDILLLDPALANTEPFKSNPNAIISINGEVNGEIKNLNIPDLEISGFRDTHIKVSGKTKGLPNMDKAIFDLNIADFTSASTDLAAFIPAKTLPSNIRLPESIKLKGTFKGGIKDFTTNLALNSSYGAAKTIATYNGSRKGNESYKATINLIDFDLGRLIKQEKNIGKITLTANINGSGTDPKHLNANLDGQVIQAVYNGYTYHNLNLTATSNQGALTAKADMVDPNITFNLQATANLSQKYPQLNLLVNLDSINLQKLHFSTENIRFRGMLSADLPTADPDYLNGNILLTNGLLAKNGQRFQLDTIHIISTASADSNTLQLKSEVLSADIHGKYKLTQVGPALQDLTNRYFAVSAAPEKPAKTSPQQFQFTAKLVNAPILKQFIPDLTEMATINFDGSFNSATGQLEITGIIPHVIYGTTNLENLQLQINTDNEALTYSLELTKINNDQIQLQNTRISGDAKNNLLTTNIRVSDKNKKEQYRITGGLKSLNNVFQFKLNPDGLVLNYQPWTVATDNEIQFGSKGIQATDFILSNNNQRISLNSTPQGLNNPVKIDFSNFKIETLTNILTKDSLLAGGTINGNALISNLQGSPVFIADMDIKDFNFHGDTLGNIALKVNNEQANAFAANVDITGKGNQVNLNGHYYTNTSSFNLSLDMGNLNLKSIEEFSLGKFKQSSGSINGNLNITGTTAAPKVIGALNFKQAALNITMLNSYFRVKDNQVDFNKDGILFNNFTLIDSAGNTASIDGNIYTQTFRDYRFALKVNSDNFRVLNSKPTNTAPYYGQLYLDSRLNIKGTLNAPVVDGNIKVNEKTYLSIVLPQNDPAIEERKGIVEFVDMKNPQLSTVLSSQVDSLNKSTVTGLDVSLNIDINKNAQFDIIIDVGNGDFLKTKGQGQLNGGIDPSGKMSLTGTYVVEEGTYELSFNFLKRHFNIQKGSTITWTGEPTTAEINVTAVYIADTAPLDLVDNQLGNASQSIRNTYKQKLPFEVSLIMKGDLLKPEVTFDIKLPEKNYNVSTDIINDVNTQLTQLRQQPSELNKQVFALLLLNRFVGENPFASSAAGGGTQSLVRQSVSKILSDQLNNLAGNLISGVELNFDLQSTEDYTTGARQNRTDLNVGISKRLLNDRLRVNVGSNFEVEGPVQPGAKTSNFAGNISVEYQLSKNGRYLLRAYQKNEYEVALQGQVIETGIGFVLTMDYNQFKEIFAKTSKGAKKRGQQNKSVKNPG
ncbi:MAG TPA: translocation/assembly module TamB domain-containing protein [Daejeonella sp.]|nr:translocation/assembly module TamB domain-containing protein [Daejeonella sp.]